MNLQVYYINDEDKPITVNVNDVNFLAAVDSGKDLSAFYHVLKPQEAKLFSLEVPDGSVCYVKRWPTHLMLSYVDPLVVAQQQPLQPKPSA